MHCGRFGWPPRRARVPVIALTAAASERDRRRPSSASLPPVEREKTRTGRRKDCAGAHHQVRRALFDVIPARPERQHVASLSHSCAVDVTATVRAGVKGRSTPSRSPTRRKRTRPEGGARRPRNWFVRRAAQLRRNELARRVRLKAAPLLATGGPEGVRARLPQPPSAGQQRDSIAKPTSCVERHLLRLRGRHPCVHRETPESKNATDSRNAGWRAPVEVPARDLLRTCCIPGEPSGPPSTTNQEDKHEHAPINGLSCLAGRYGHRVRGCRFPGNAAA